LSPRRSIVARLIEAGKSDRTFRFKPVEHRDTQCDIVRAGHPARAQQGVDLGRQTIPLTLRLIEIVERQDRGRDAECIEPPAEPFAQRRLAASLRTADADPERPQFAIPQPHSDRRSDNFKTVVHAHTPSRPAKSASAATAPSFALPEQPGTVPRIG
jgi:hypothetical protein